MKNALFLCNPQAGRGNIKNDFLELVDILSREGYQVTVYPTQGAMDAQNFVEKQAAGYEMLVVSGGDGTLNETVNGLMLLPEEARPIVGYIPAGSTNDFANSLGIPKNRKRAAFVAATGDRFSCDVGLFNDKHFVYVAAFGAFTDVAYDTPQRFKNALGHMAYILEGIKRLPSLKSYEMLVESQDVRIQDSFIYGMVSNTTSVGGMARKDATVSLNDGLFEVVLIRTPQNLAEVQSIVTSILTGDYSSPLFTVFKTGQVSFNSQDPVEWTLDGEYGGAVETARVSILESAIQVMVEGEKSVKTKGAIRVAKGKEA